MNDFNVSGTNAYSRPVQFGSDSRDVDSVGVSDAGKIGGSPAGNRGVTMTKADRFMTPSVGSDKHVLVAAEFSDIDVASDAVTSFLAGLKQTDDETVDKSKLHQNWTRRTEKEEKKEDVELDASKVLSEVDTVSNKSAAVSFMIDTQAQSLIRKNAEENANRTANRTNKVLQGVEIALKALSTIASVRGNFLGEGEKVKKAITESVSKVLEFGGDVAHIFKVSGDADDSVVRANQDEAFRSLMQNASGYAKNMITIFRATGEKAQDTLENMQEERRETEKQLHVSSN